MSFDGSHVKIEKVDQDTGCPVAKIRINRRNQCRMRSLAFVGHRFWYSREIQGRIKRVNRQSSRKKKGSKNRKRVSQHYARTHRKIARQREAHHWKLALEIIRKFDVSFFEDLNLQGIISKKLETIGGRRETKFRWEPGKFAESAGI